MKQITVRGVCVDSGLILVADLSYFKQFESVKLKHPLAHIIKVANGKYQVEWDIPDNWNGDVSGVEDLIVTSGEVIIVDPCYVIQDKGKQQKQWQKWLDDTDYGMALNADNAFILDEMGGDGEYTVNLTLTKITT